MVHVAPPSPTTAPTGTLTYADAYNIILTNYRKALLTSASSVVVLVAPNVDALCAARMLADLFKLDDVQHSIRPVSGILELERVRDELLDSSELHTLIMLNMGGILDLPSPEWFGDFEPQLTVHIIDSARPFNLSSLFGTGAIGDRILVWDDGEVDRLVEERRAWEFITFEPEYDSDEDSNADSEVEKDEDEDEVEDDYEQDTENGAKRRPVGGDGDGNSSKRRRIHDGVSRRVSREERNRYATRLNKYYKGGTWYGQTAAATIYILANALGQVDNDMLWLGILGLTYHYTTSRLSREKYEQYQAIYHDEVSRLNPPIENNSPHALVATSPDDTSIRSVEELRFTHFRHWNLYDAMFHTSYVASKLGLWKERGQKRLAGLLAKMGFSLAQTQQPYQHMDVDLKKSLFSTLANVAPEYGLVELIYPSFVRCLGYKMTPLSAADIVDILSTLMEVDQGIEIQIEEEGARNGGEWFGGGRIWESGAAGSQLNRTRVTNNASSYDPPPTHDEISENGEETPKSEEPWWVKNFWTAYDTLTNSTPVKKALLLSMALHRAIIRQGTSIIDHQNIRTTRTHRVVVLTQGPDLALFSHPAVLSRLALWLVDALRDRVPTTSLQNSKKKSLPFVVACLDEARHAFVVVGVMGAPEFGDVQKNAFSAAFIHAQARCNAEIKHVSFDTNVVQIHRDELSMFLEALCEGPEQ